MVFIFQTSREKDKMIKNKINAKEGKKGDDKKEKHMWEAK